MLSGQNELACPRRASLGTIPFETYLLILDNVSDTPEEPFLSDRPRYHIPKTWRTYASSPEACTNQRSLSSTRKSPWQSASHLSSFISQTHYRATGRQFTFSMWNTFLLHVHPPVGINIYAHIATMVVLIQPWPSAVSQPISRRLPQI